MNSSGLAVGVQYGTDNPTYAYGNNHGVIFNSVTGTSTDIGGVPLGFGNAATGNSSLKSVADNGTVVGNASSAASRSGTAFIGTVVNGAYAYTDLTTAVTTAAALAEFVVDSSSASDISANGRCVIGTHGATNADESIFATRSFHYDTLTGLAVDLGTISGATDADSSANGVNDLGQVVGTSTSATGTHGFLYTNGAIYDLNALVPVTGVAFTNA